MPALKAVKAGDLYGSLYVITVFRYREGRQPRTQALCWCRDWLTYGIFRTDSLLSGQSTSCVHREGRRLPDIAIVDPELEDVLRANIFWFEDDGYIKSKEGKMHRMVYELVTGQSIPKDKMVDHINGVKHDNRFCNLRLVNSRQNNLNSAPRIKAKGDSRGVHYCKSKKMWIARHSINKRVHIGQFNTEAEAYQARLEYIQKHYPEDIEYLRECISCSTE